MNRLLELVTDSATGNLSHTKIWSHVAYATVTYKFIVSEQPVEIWFIYLGIVGSHNVLNNWITKKYGNEPERTETVVTVGRVDKQSLP